MFTRQVRGDKVLLLVQISYSGFGCFLHNYLKVRKIKERKKKNRCTTCFYYKGCNMVFASLSQKRDLRVYQTVSQARPGTSNPDEVFNITQIIFHKSISVLERTWYIYTPAIRRAV